MSNEPIKLLLKDISLFDAFVDLAILLGLSFSIFLNPDFELEVWLYSSNRLE